MSDTTPSNSIISVRQLTKTYTMGDVHVYALRSVDLDVSRGEFIAIMGPSGSGKSTFMNILGCLDIPTKGSYHLDNEEIGAMTLDQLARLRNRKLGYVFQSFNLLSRTSAFENVELPLMYSSELNSAQRKEKVMNALAAVGLAERAHHYPNQLSGGQQQRVAIARALVNDPVVILADEPTGNLDTRTSLEVIQIFHDLNAKGITIVMVTHEPDIASYTNRNVVFRDGKLHSNTVVEKPRDPAEDLKDTPALFEEDEEEKTATAAEPSASGTKA